MVSNGPCNKHAFCTQNHVLIPIWSFLFCQTKQVCVASEEEEKGEEVKIKEELFHDESDEEKLVEDEPVFDTHNHQKNEKAK